MINKPHVGFIDAHTECIGRDDHVGAVRHELFLNLAALRCFQPAVIKKRMHALSIERAHDLFGRFPGRDIHDSRFLRPANPVHQRLSFLLFFLKTIYAQVNVRPVKILDEDLGLSQPKPLNYRSELQVIRPEIVPPLADTMRLVHNKELDPSVF